MYFWTIRYDAATRGPRHEVRAGFGHALIAPMIARTFRILRVTAAIWEHGQDWVPLTHQPNVATFELEHGRERERVRHNTRQLAAAVRLCKVVHANYSGYTDFFAPIVVDHRVVAVLVVGPIAPALPTSAEVLERWRKLTGRQGHPADPEFAAFLAVTLGTLVLDADGMSSFGQLLDCLTRLMAGTGDAEALANRAERLRAELELARGAEWTWEVVRDTLDPRLERTSRSQPQSNALRDRGLSHPVDHVLVALTRSLERDVDPVDAAVRRYGFQRGVVEVARATGQAIAGQVGEHGAVLLCSVGTGAQRKRKLIELAAQVTRFAARRFDLAVHFGLGEVTAGSSPHRAYQDALASADQALVEGRTALDFRRPTPKIGAHSLRQLRVALGRSLEQRPEIVLARFDRYVEATTASVGHRMEAVRTQLEMGFERLLEEPLTTGVLDAKSAESLLGSLELTATRAVTTHELAEAYRRAAADVCRAVEHPGSAHQERSLRRAEEYVRQHYTESIRLTDVARVAGFAPAYFSTLFHASTRQTFTEYVRGLRFARARELLTGTSLGLNRVAELSGLRTRQYLNQVFRREIRMTPLAYRRRETRRPARREKRARR